MSLESNHTAAGIAETANRVEVKQEWYKKPTGLHFATAALVIVVALIINFSFTFNVFWKLLLGVALIWGGNSLKNATMAPAKLWGNIFRGIGWVVIVVAFLNSGLRAVAENGAIKINEALNEVAATIETPAGTASVPGTAKRAQLPDGEIIEINLKDKSARQRVDVRMSLNDTARVKGDYPKDEKGSVIADGVTAMMICAQVTEPTWVLRDTTAPKQHMRFLDLTKVGFVHDMKFTEEVKTFLILNDVTTVTVSFYLVKTTVGMHVPC